MQSPLLASDEMASSHFMAVFSTPVLLLTFCERVCCGVLPMQGPSSCLFSACLPGTQQVDKETTASIDSSSCQAEHEWHDI